MWTTCFVAITRPSPLAALGRTTGARRCSSTKAGGGLCIAIRRNASPSRKKSTPKFAPQMRTAFSSMAWKIGSSWPAEELMTRNTSAVAFSRSSASSRSRQSRADSLSARIVLALRRFGIALRLRALVGLLLALERRRIARPKGLGLRQFSKSITAGICDRRNGVKVHSARQQPKSPADAAPSAKCGAPQDRADLNLLTAAQVSLERLHLCCKGSCELVESSHRTVLLRKSSPRLDSEFWGKIETDPP